MASGQQIRLDLPTLYPQERGISYHVVADLDSDGYSDVAVISRANMRLFFNRGDGTLADEVTIPTASAMVIYGIHAGDLDQDGFVDLAWSYRDGNRNDKIYFYYNDGDGRTGEIHEYVLSDGPHDFALGDMDGDGDLDVLYFQSDTAIGVLENRGRSDYAARQVYEFPDPDYHPPWESLAVGDFDRDGDLDAAALLEDTYTGSTYKCYDTKVVILSNDGRAHFVSNAIDLPWRSDNERFMNQVRIGDIDGDGWSDLLVGASYHRDNGMPAQVAVLINQQDGRTFEREPLLNTVYGSWAGMDMADLDLDGRLDLLQTSSADRGIHIWRNLGNGQWSQPLSYAILMNWADPFVAELDGDGRWDLTVSDGEGLVTSMNITPLSGPRLQHSALRRGERAQFVVDRAMPDETVYFLYSRAGAGNHNGVPPLGGLTLDLRDPVGRIGTARTNGNGRAVLEFTVPPSAPVGPVAVQAVIRRGIQGTNSVKTPFSTAVIE